MAIAFLRLRTAIAGAIAGAIAFPRYHECDCVSGDCVFAIASLVIVQLDVAVLLVATCGRMLTP